MEYKTLNNGIQMPAVGFGTWDLRAQECVKCVDQAIRTGYRLIDTAIMYGNEAEVGEGIRRSGIDRTELFVTTKINSPYAFYEKTLAAVDQSLKRMNLDYIDLILVHEPYPQYIQMYRALEEVYRQKKVRAIGVSNLNRSLYEKLLEDCETIPAVNQVECHVYYPQLGYKTFLEQHGTVMESWAPFTEGRRNIFDNPVLKQIAHDHGKTTGQTALKYLVQNGIIVIPKTSKETRMKENISLFDFELNPQEMNMIAQLDEKRSLFGWY